MIYDSFIIAAVNILLVGAAFALIVSAITDPHRKGS